jgi:hypothetical protein
MKGGAKHRRRAGGAAAARRKLDGGSKSGSGKRKYQSANESSQRNWLSKIFIENDGNGGGNRRSWLK